MGTGDRLFTRLGATLAFVRGSPRGVPGPVELVVEVTNRCNQACVMCPRDRSERAVGDMGVGPFTGIMEEVEGRVAFVDLSLDGEPLLHPSIAEIISIAKSKGMVVYLQTNATPLTEEVGRDLLEAGLDLITLSIDAARPETYARLRPPGPPLEEVEEKVDSFLGMASAKGRPFTMVQMVRLGLNRHEEGAFATRWRRKAGAVRFKAFDDRAGRVDPSLGRGDPGRWAPNAACPRIWRGMAVLWDGRAVPCCKDVEGRSIMGDVFEEGVLGIWDGPEMGRLRRAHSAGKSEEIPLCRDCLVPSKRLLNALAFTIISPLAARRLAGAAGRLAPRK